MSNVTGRNNTAIWVAPIISRELTALRLRSSGRRVTRCRSEGWMPAAGADWFQAPPGPTPGQDFVSSAADWPGVDWSHHLQMAGGNFTIGHGGGRCDDMLSGVGYWCGIHVPRGDQFVHGGPCGLRNPRLSCRTTRTQIRRDWLFICGQDVRDVGESGLSSLCSGKSEELEPMVHWTLHRVAGPRAQKGGRSTVWLENILWRMHWSCWTRRRTSGSTTL